VINENQVFVNTITNTIFAWLYKLSKAEEDGINLDELHDRLSTTIEAFDAQVEALVDETDEELFLDDFTNAITQWNCYGGGC